MCHRQQNTVTAVANVYVSVIDDDEGTHYLDQYVSNQILSKLRLYASLSPFMYHIQPVTNVQLSVIDNDENTHYLDQYAINQRQFKEKGPVSKLTVGTLSVA